MNTQTQDTAALIKLLLGSAKFGGYYKAAADKLEELQADVDRLETMLDPPICRQQFPDGGVPGNIVECAEGWKLNAERFWKERDQFENRLSAVLAAETTLRDIARIVENPDDRALQQVRDLLDKTEIGQVIDAQAHGNKP